jgi:MarR family transcriptional repressor of emrRAB
MEARQKAENLLGAAALAIQDAISAAFRSLDLKTNTDAAALVLLKQSNKLSISSMAVLLDLEHSSMVRAVDRLVSRRLVTRESNPADARQAVLALTPAGGRLAERVLDVRGAALTRMLGALRPEDISAITSLLSKILAKHTTSRQSADRLCRLCDEKSCGGDQCPVECAALTQMMSGMPSEP